MAFKRPTPGRSNSSGRASGRPSNTGGKPKRTFASGENKGAEADKKPFRRFDADKQPADGKNRAPKTFKQDRSDKSERQNPSERQKISNSKKFEKDFAKPAIAKHRSPDSPDKPDRKGGNRQWGKKRDGVHPFKTERKPYSKPAFRGIAPNDAAPAKVTRGRKKATEIEDTGLIRLNRYISNAGICSRRKADELIAAGVISVNGEVISELGAKVDPRKDVVRYNGETLKREKMVYVLLNKPKDYITTTDDPQERRTVMHLVEKASRERIYPVGRLDRNTTGLLLMTNDGELADKLSHPRNSIVKLYQAELNKNLTQGDLNKIAFGVELEDGLIKPDAIAYVSGGTKREIGIQIHSGKNRIVRRIFEHLGYEVVKLDRVVYANLTKKDLPRGRWRYLEESEVIQLKHLI